jgi:hypothetical protein
MYHTEEVFWSNQTRWELQDRLTVQQNLHETSKLTLIPAMDSSLCEAIYAISELFKFFSTKYITSETPDCKDGKLNPFRN